jgi:hypothetical protein
MGRSRAVRYELRSTWLSSPGRAPVPSALLCTPIAPEILPAIECEFSYSDCFPGLDAHHSHAAVLAFATLLVREVEIPVYGCFALAEKIEDVGNTDALDVEMDPRILLKVAAEPFLCGALSSKSAALRYVARIEKHAIFSPSRHEFRQVLPVYGVECFGLTFFGGKCSDQMILLSVVTSRLLLPDPDKWPPLLDRRLTARQPPADRAADGWVDLHVMQRLHKALSAHVL